MTRVNTTRPPGWRHSAAPAKPVVVMTLWGSTTVLVTIQLTYLTIWSLLHNEYADLIFKQCRKDVYVPSLLTNANLLIWIAAPAMVLAVVANYVSPPRRCTAVRAIVIITCALLLALGISSYGQHTDLVYQCFG